MRLNKSMKNIKNICNHLFAVDARCDNYCIVSFWLGLVDSI